MFSIFPERPSRPASIYSRDEEKGAVAAEFQVFSSFGGLFDDVYARLTKHPEKVDKVV